MTESRLAGRVAIITGGGSGIGRAAALRVASEGSSVVIGDVQLDAAEAVARDVEDAGGASLAVACDVSEESQVENLVQATVDRFSTVTTLFANAGVAAGGFATHEMPLENWFRTLSVDLTGVFLSVKHSLPPMLANGGGAIVTCGSTSSVVAPGGGGVAYRSAKGGVLQLTRAVAVEYAAEGIRANCVCPGPVDTNIQANTQALTGSTPKRRFEVPMKRRGTAEEVASVVAFLVSDEASFMTGQAVLVDGGMTAE